MQWRLFNLDVFDVQLYAFYPVPFIFFDVVAGAELFSLAQFFNVVPLLECNGRKREARYVRVHYFEFKVVFTHNACLAGVHQPAGIE